MSDGESTLPNRRRLDRFLNVDIDGDEVSDKLIKEYLCEKTDMYFYTNPNEIPGTNGAGSTILDMNCEVFTLWDDATQRN